MYKNNIIPYVVITEKIQLHMVLYNIFSKKSIKILAKILTYNMANNKLIDTK